MTRDLFAATDTGSFILCDVSFARSLNKPIASKLEPQVTAGDALLYSFGGDGEVGMRLLLDENVPEAFLPKACEHQRDLLLKIPTGRLLWCGLEFTGIETDKFLSHRRAAEGCTAEVSPGHYLAEVYELDWGEEPDAIAAEERARMLKGRVTLGWQVLTQVMGWSAVLGFFGTPVALFIAYRIGGWTACGKTLGVIVILYLLFCGVASLKKRHPSQQAYDEVLRQEEEIFRRFPKAVVHLERVPEGTDVAQLRGGKFGAGFR